MSRRTLVIVNPRSAGGRTGRRWHALAARLRTALGPFEVARTRGPRDAERIAHGALRDGVARILVAGGDGTLSEVATGLLAEGPASDVELAVLPLGTGSDFTRGLGIPDDPQAALAFLAKGEARAVDAGRVTFQGETGPRSACFVNVASFGISGLVNARVSGSSRALGGTAAFAYGAVRGILAYRTEHVVVRLDGELVHDGPLVLAAGANAPYFGGGMQVAPGARVDDGRFDLVLVGAVSKLRLLRLLALCYRGHHLGDPAVAHHRGRSIEADAPPGRVPIELDGECLGTLPARYELLPAALTIIGAPR